jgi:hypothetical protein
LPNKGADSAAPQPKDLLASGGGPSSDLVEGRVANLIDAYLRSALNHFPQGLQHSWIGIAAIGVGILFLIPQTDSDGFGAPRDDERHFVPEALLLPKQRKDFLFDQTGELRNAIRLQVDGDTASKYVNLLGCFGVLRRRGSDHLT